MYFLKIFDVIWGLIHFWKLIIIDIKNFPQFLRKFSTNVKLFLRFHFPRTHGIWSAKGHFWLMLLNLGILIRYLLVLWIFFWIKNVLNMFSPLSCSNLQLFKHSICLHLAIKPTHVVIKGLVWKVAWNVNKFCVYVVPIPHCMLSNIADTVNKH